MKNELYQELRDYVKENSGFGSALLETNLYKKYLKAKEGLRIFDGKKVKLKYTCRQDFMGSAGIKFGKLIFHKDEKGNEEIRFFEGQKRSKYYTLDLGLYEGFYAVFIIDEIEEADKKEFSNYMKEQREIKFKRRYGF